MHPATLLQPTPACSDQDASPTGNLKMDFAVAGRWLRVAKFRDEEWIDRPPLEDPAAAVASLRSTGQRADLFTFADPLGSTEIRFPNHGVEWDNAAAVRITTFQDWWENRLPQVTRKSVRRSEKRGLSVRPVEFNDTLVVGIKRIYDETPIRQGRRFWHYGKDLETIKAENSSYLARSDFVGAYFEEELVGFLKVVFVGNVGRIMQVLSLNAHADKRPTNALLAKGVERCCQRGAHFFVYGKYVYGNKRNSPVTEFKRRNGFDELTFPRYHIPLTLFGWISVQLGLHQGLLHALPESVTDFLLRTRAAIYARTRPPEPIGE